MRLTHAVATPRLTTQSGRVLSLAADPAPSLADVVDQVVGSMAPFEQAVVRMRYDVGQGVRRAAESLSASPDDVAAALMRAYRSIAAALERTSLS